MDELTYRIVKETLKGGPAYYRPSYMAPDEYAKYRVDQTEAEELSRGKVLYVRRRWLFAIIRLPQWAPIGKPLE